MLEQNKCMKFNTTTINEKTPIHPYIPAGVTHNTSLLQQEIAFTEVPKKYIITLESVWALGRLVSFKSFHFCHQNNFIPKTLRQIQF